MDVVICTHLIAKRGDFKSLAGVSTKMAAFCGCGKNRRLAGVT